MAQVLIVDDELGLRVSLAAFLRKDGHEVQTAEDVATALGILDVSTVDVVVSDIVMPGGSGLDLLARIHERENGIAVILLTGEPNVETAAGAVRHSAFDYLHKPIARSALLTVVAKAARAKAQFDLNKRLSEENERYRSDLEGLVETRTMELSAALRGTIGVITRALETRDPYTAGHQRGTANLSRAMARILGFTETIQTSIEMAALVHDVGKIAIPADILAKPTRLTPVEFAIVKDHPGTGFEILRTVAFPWPIAEIIVQHHERMDGSGYPAGLKGDEIREEARILCVADVVEAMLSHRPYRAALELDVVLEELTRNRDVLYHGGAVDACVALFQEDGFQIDYGDA